MYYETKSLQSMVDKMNSCDALGLTYVVQKELVVIDKFFGMVTETVPFYKLQVVQFKEEEEEHNED